jgi:hypothetical protein
MVSRLDPNEEQLKPFSLTRVQYRHLSMLATGAHSGDGFTAEHVEVWRRLEGRGLVAHRDDKWLLTPQGEAFLRSITELLGP